MQQIVTMIQLFIIALLVPVIDAFVNVLIQFKQVVHWNYLIEVLSELVQPLLFGRIRIKIEVQRTAVAYDNVIINFRWRRWMRWEMVLMCVWIERVAKVVSHFVLETINCY